MALTFPQGSNVVIPDHEASGRLVVEYSRNPDSFALNRYAQIVPTDKRRGYYMSITAEQAARLLSTDMNELRWPDTADAPKGEDMESFGFLLFETQRHAPTERLGDIAVEEASWDLKRQAQGICAHRAILGRTQKAYSVLTNTANHDTGHYATATALAGGTFTAATTANPYIRKAIMAALLVIEADTLGKVGIRDLNFVMGPETAIDIGESQEFLDYLKGSPDAFGQIKGDLQNYNREYNLPAVLYNVAVQVDNAVKVTSPKLATRVASRVWAGGNAVLMARVGGITSEIGPSFSSLSIFARKGSEMAVEDVYETVHKRSLVRVIDDYDVRLTAPAATYLITSAITP